MHVLVQANLCAKIFIFYKFCTMYNATAYTYILYIAIH